MKIRKGKVTILVECLSCENRIVFKSTQASAQVSTMWRLGWRRKEINRDVFWVCDYCVENKGEEE